MSSDRADEGRLGVEVDEDALEVRRVRAEARRRLFGETASKTRIGRYELGPPVGAGAMGTVYRAFDPQLRREVALKVLHPIASSNGGERARKRLLREGRSMARVDHDNVATILDVGRDGARVFLAMELVEGTDLATWLEGRPPWRAVLDAFAAAARGLAAAHDAGVVHRDFKPHNVLRYTDGRVRVVDFGLAAAARGFTEELEGGDEALTKPGTALGTPAYMAPEQREGVADARADQYAFCVALARALESSPPPPAVRRRLERVAALGRSRDPDRRFSDMHEVVAALEQAPRSRSWPVAAVAIVALGALAWWVWPARHDAPPSSDAETQTVRSSIDPDEANSVRALLESAEQLERDGDLEGAQRQAVEASRVALAVGDLGLQSDAWRLRSELAERRSDDEAALQAGLQAAWLAIDAQDDRRLADAAIHVAFLHASNAGEPDEAHRWSRIGRAAAQRLGMPDDLEILLDQLQGIIAMSRGDYDQARPAFERALDRARRLHGPDAHALSPMLFNLGAVAYSTSDFAAAKEAWLDAARIEEAALGPEHPEVASALSNLAIALMALRDYELAAQTHARALAIREASLDADSPKIADSHHNLGIVLALQGDFDAARHHHQAAQGIRTAVYGASHPSVGSSHAALGNLALRTENWDDARRHHQQAVDLWLPTMGPEHPDVVRSMARVAEAELGLGRPEVALAGTEAALHSWLPRLSSTHQDVLAARAMQGTCLLELGRDDEARRVLVAAVEEATAAGLPPESRAELQFTLIRALWRDPDQRSRATALAEALRAELDAAALESIPIRERVAGWLSRRSSR